MPIFAALTAVFILVIGVSGCTHSKTTSHNPVDKVSTSPEPLDANPAESEVRAELARIQLLVSQKKYDDAVKAYDTALEHAASVPLDSDTYSTYGDYIRSLRQKTKCLKRRDPEKIYKDKKELLTALTAALKSSDTKALTQALSCRTMLGMPFSEFDDIHNPEKLAAELVLLRKKMPFESSTQNRGSVIDLRTTGYADGEVRIFELSPPEHGLGWQVTGIIHGGQDAIDQLLTQ